MNEAFQWNYEEIQSIEGNSENQTISSLSDGRNQVQEKATQFYLSNRDNPESIQGLKELIQHQEEDRSKLQDSISEQTRLETTEELDKEALTNEVKIILYEKI